MTRLSDQIASQLADVTLEKSRALGLKHAQENLPLQPGDSKITALVGRGRARPAIVVGAGPSLHSKESLQRIKSKGFKGVVISTDGAFRVCLKNDIIPDYVISLDPHPERIVRWFGDPSLNDTILEDDYFRRQDLDPGFNRDEKKVNAELIALVNQHGPRVTAVLSSSCSPSVVKRCRQAGMPISWWNPLYDDYDQENSLSRQVNALNGIPCINAGGNCGTAGWVFAHSVLECDPVGLIGFDFSYRAELPYLNTQYYYELRDMVGEENLDEAYTPYTNPLTGEKFYTDPTYLWYRQSFLEMLQDAPGRTINITEGGILFGPDLPMEPLEKFLTEHPGR